MQGGVSLRKTPHGIELSVRSRIETAAGRWQTGQRRYRSEIVVTEISLLSPPPDGGSDDVEHYVSGQSFAPAEFSGEPEITQEEVPY